MISEYPFCVNVLVVRGDSPIFAGVPNQCAKSCQALGLIGFVSTPFDPSVLNPEMATATCFSPDRWMKGGGSHMFQFVCPTLVWLRRSGEAQADRQLHKPPRNASTCGLTRSIAGMPPRIMTASGAWPEKIGPLLPFECNGPVFSIVTREKQMTGRNSGRWCKVFTTQRIGCDDQPVLQ